MNHAKLIFGDCPDPPDPLLATIFHVYIYNFLKFKCTAYLCLMYVVCLCICSFTTRTHLLFGLFVHLNFLNHLHFSFNFNFNFISDSGRPNAIFGGVTKFNKYLEKKKFPGLWYSILTERTKLTLCIVLRQIALCLDQN